MSIALNIEQYIERQVPGQVFGYQALPSYDLSPAAVTKAVSRLVKARRLARLSKGKFYVPKKGILGEQKPSDSELIKSILYDKNKLRGYVTGTALYNRLGLTTQIPKTVEIAYDGAPKTKDFGTIQIKQLTSRAPIKDSNIKLLQYLDALKDIKNIPDSDINMSLQIMREKIGELPVSDQKKLVGLAREYYGPQARALTGLVLESLGPNLGDNLKKTLNPLTIFKLKIDSEEWPNKQSWNIKA